VKKVLSSAVILLILSGCGTVSTVRPLAPGERAVAFSLGGPVATVPGVADIVIPYSVVRYRWGVIENLEAHVGIHPTIIVFGTLGIDFGLSYEFLEGSKYVPSLCLGLNPTVLVNPFNPYGTGARPEAELVASWFVKPWFLLYTGGQAFFQLEKDYVPFAVLLGSEFKTGKHLGLALEFKWYVPYKDSEPPVVVYPVSPFEHGALGLVLGLNLYPGDRDE